MDTKDGTDKINSFKKMYIFFFLKKDGMSHCACLFSYVTTKHVVQIVLFSPYPFQSGGEKYLYFYNKICGFFGLVFF